MPNTLDCHLLGVCTPNDVVVFFGICIAVAAVVFTFIATRR